jgi:hypothetical protein
MLARLQAYPLIIVVLYIFPTINRMNSWFGGSAVSTTKRIDQVKKLDLKKNLLSHKRKYLDM